MTVTLHKILIVDALSSGYGFIELASLPQYQIFHLLSSELEQNIKHPPHTFSEQHIKTANKIKSTLPANCSLKQSDYTTDDEMIVALKKYNFTAVIPGHEDAVVLAEQIAGKLNIKHSNDYHTSQLRRDKHAMQKQLKVDGLNYIPYLYTDNVDEIITWFLKNNFSKIVLKATELADGKGVYFCSTVPRIKKCFKQIVNVNKFLDKKNTVVLAEEYITGQQHILNSYITGGKVFIDAMFRLTFLEQNNVFLYKTIELINRDLAQYQSLLEYNKLVLKSLGFKYGYAHAEYRIRDNKIYLIEVGARVMGGSILENHKYQQLIGYNPLERTVKSYLSLKELEDDIAQAPFQKVYFSSIYSAIPKSGIVKAMPIVKLIQNESHILKFDIFKPGTKVTKSTRNNNLCSTFIGGTDKTKYQNLKQLLEYVFYKQPKYYITYQDDVPVPKSELNAFADRFNLKNA